MEAAAAAEADVVGAPPAELRMMAEVYMHVHVYTYVYIDTICIYTCICICICICICTYTYMRVPHWYDRKEICNAELP